MAARLARINFKRPVNFDAVTVAYFVILFHRTPPDAKSEGAEILARKLVRNA